MGALFFVRADAAHGAELWVNDGISDVVTLVRDINPGAASSFISGLQLVGDTLFFSANDGVHGPELWRSNGTVGGTNPVRLFVVRFGSG